MVSPTTRRRTMAVAIVTGASRGFGKALATDLAATGWDLVLDARGASALDAVAAGIRAAHPDVRVAAIPGDMRTQMHQEAFPGEDISDRPEPETIVPALRRLLFERPASGRYRGADFQAVV